MSMYSSTSTQNHTVHPPFCMTFQLLYDYISNENSPHFTVNIFGAINIFAQGNVVYSLHLSEPGCLQFQMKNSIEIKLNF